MSLGPEARARLHARYLAGLSERLDVMVTLRARLDAADPQASEEARSLGHQFAGTGASFGLPELSERGQDLEQCDDDQRAQALDRLIAAVRAAVQRQG
ncbi:Hpt domain-containing protein [Paraliomyxa miuraensis]|uniref:Hpt domain-containing protein n=1 Tax=Paraliomyxa miuraensis TaxID=376150 RepID=UPI00225B50BE|nr:Hpt domain-containing protein [Paraliomyxa miuraensis]MCX4246466.1 Hpt domain-containing protein [Paraliomyxa miuraensis]